MNECTKGNEKEETSGIYTILYVNNFVCISYLGRVCLCEMVAHHSPMWLFVICFLLFIPKKIISQSTWVARLLFEKTVSAKCARQYDTRRIRNDGATEHSQAKKKKTKHAHNE